MANEITVGGSLSVVNGNLSVSKQFSGLRFDMTGDSYSANAQSIGTTYEALTIGADVGNQGWCIMRNLDATNYVEIGLDGGADLDPFIRLEAGEFALFRLSPAIAPYGKADTAAVVVEFIVIED